MRVGFTYDLKDDYLKAGYSAEYTAEFDSELTIDAIAEALESLGHSVDRVGNFAALSARLVDSKLGNSNWDIVFNICEGVRGFGRESLVPAMLDAYNIPYTFSGPLVHAITLNKAVTKIMLRAAGLPTTEHTLISSVDEIANPPFDYPVFIKAVAEGTGKSITPESKVNNGTELQERVKAMLTHFKQPVIVEPLLTGREVTVGIVGTGEWTQVVGVMNIGFTDKADSDFHSYFNKENCDEAAIYELAVDDYAQKCAILAVKAHKALGICDASRVDIRADGAGEPQIMEINSLPGLMPGHSDLILLGEMAGYSYGRIIEAIFESALMRYR
ncbi:D-alanine--D-alanine ligase [Deferribacterales bacterium RsTz2092]